jgi:hypothetical protein
VRYHEVQRYRMELKQLAEKYRKVGLDHDELVDASVEELTRLRDGKPEYDTEDEHARAADYELRFNERDKQPE